MRGRSVNKTVALLFFVRPGPVSVILFVYGPYGQHDCSTGQTAKLGFNGERYDPLTRSYALGQGYRNYSPALMRFQSPDDLSPFAQGGLNAYAYCVNDPINLLDATGHAPTAGQLHERIKQMGLKVPSATSQVHGRANASKRQSLPRPLSASRDAKPKKTLRFNETTETFFYEEERSKFKGQLYQERKAIINYMGREYRVFELYQRELNTLLAPTTEAMFKQSKNPRGHLALITFTQSQLDDAHERLRQLNKTLKSIRL